MPKQMFQKLAQNALKLVTADKGHEVADLMNGHPSNVRANAAKAIVDTLKGKPLDEQAALLMADRGALPHVLTRNGQGPAVVGMLRDQPVATQQEMVHGLGFLGRSMRSNGAGDDYADWRNGLSAVSRSPNSGIKP